MGEAGDNGLQMLVDSRAPAAVGAPGGMSLFQGAVGIALTLYMMAILLRWAAPWLELNMRSWWVRVIAAATDPLIALMRRLLPPMGPVDWGPIAALVAVWVLRIILVQY